LTGGNFVKAPKWRQDQAISKLGKVAPEISGELGFINERIVEAKAASQTLKQRAMIPEFNDLLTKLEKVSGTPAPKAIAESVAKKAENRQLVKRLHRQPAMQRLLGPQFPAQPQLNHMNLKIIK